MKSCGKNCIVRFLKIPWKQSCHTRFVRVWVLMNGCNCQYWVRSRAASAYSFSAELQCHSSKVFTLANFPLLTAQSLSRAGAG